VSSEFPRRERDYGVAAARGSALMRRIFALVFMLAPASAFAGTADTLRLTLDDALRLAATGGAEMREARAGVADARGKVREALAAALPHVSGSVTYTRKLDSVFRSFSGDTLFGPIFRNSAFAAVNTWDVELTGSQLLWSSGKVGAALRAARAAHRSADAGAAETAAEVRYQVTRAYLDAAYAGERVGIARAAWDQARAHFAQVALQHREGRRADYDLLRAEVDAANQEPGVTEADADYDIATLELERLIGVPPGTPVVLATPLAFGHDMVPVVADEALAVEERPAVRATQADAEARHQLWLLEKGGRWPDLTLSTTLAQQAYPDDRLPRLGQFRRDWQASVKLEVPIFSGLRTEGRIAQARAAYDRAMAERDLVRDRARVEAAAARADLARSLALLVARRATVRQADRAATLASLRYTNGLSTQLEVSDARLQHRTALVNAVGATHDYLVAMARLERALGHPVVVSQVPLDRVTAFGPRFGAPPDPAADSQEGRSR
jgi:outer membrane protein TolC